MKLEVRNLKKTYGTVQALKGINYTFTPGVYGILGANGAGKSTMINLITDNVSERQDEWRKYSFWRGQCRGRYIKAWQTVQGSGWIHAAAAGILWGFFA